MVTQVEPLSHLQLLQLQERIQILEEEQVELVNIPVPEFGDGDPAKIVHDFQRVSVHQDVAEPEPGPGPASSQAELVPVGDPAVCLPTEPDRLLRPGLGQLLRHPAQHLHRHAPPGPAGVAGQHQGIHSQLAVAVEGTDLPAGNGAPGG